MEAVREGMDESLRGDGMGGLELGWGDFGRGSGLVCLIR